MPTCANVVCLSHRPSKLCGMQLRYRYRLDPTPAQRQALARAFGCARVVYNDGLRLREDAYRAGLPFVGGGGAVPTGRHARQADPGTGVARGGLCRGAPAVAGRSGPRLPQLLPGRCNEVKAARARGEQGEAARSASLGSSPAITSRRSGSQPNSRFRVLPDGRLSLPKVGRPEGPLVASSARCPVLGHDHPGRRRSVPRLLRGRGRCGTARPSRDSGRDRPRPVGLRGVVGRSEARQPTLVAGARERALRRSQRNMCTQAEGGSRNREKARRKVARLHARVTDTRRDFHHQLSTRLVREHQTVCVETLNVVALGREQPRQVRSTTPGWSTFVGMLEYKANLYGRTLVRVDRMFPSSQLCSACGHRDGPKPLKVRTWTCPDCGTVHDRDLNAAKNILAAGLAVTACGPGVRPSASRAVGDEAGTTLAGAA